MPSKKPAVAPKTPLKVPGFRASGIACGIKKNGRKDLALILSDVPARVAALFTTNRVKAAPVLIDMKRVKKGTSRGVVVNSGNANACSGARGYRDALSAVSAVEDAAGVKRGSLMAASTGVIGVPLPVERIKKGAKELVEGLSCDGLGKAAEAMMTTDAFPKTAFAKARIGGRAVTVAGVAKGAGMICPNMATMLAFIMTDASVKSPALDRALKHAVENSFNSIIVDNDTSTNDTVLIFANGASGAPEIRYDTPEYMAFSKALDEVSLKLAHMMVKDGEGATKFIEIDIRGAVSQSDAIKAARTIAGSFLVKTAFFGGDPNWGRIMAAIGRAGIRLKEDRTDISFNGVPVVKGGLDTGKEKVAARALKAKDIVVNVNLGVGKAGAKVWTSDLSYEYVKINSAYRT